MKIPKVHKAKCFDYRNSGFLCNALGVNIFGRPMYLRGKARPGSQEQRKKEWKLAVPFTESMRPRLIANGLSIALNLWNRLSDSEYRRDVIAYGKRYHP